MANRTAKLDLAENSLWLGARDLIFLFFLVQSQLHSERMFVLPWVLINVHPQLQLIEARVTTGLRPKRPTVRESGEPLVKQNSAITLSRRMRWKTERKAMSHSFSYQTVLLGPYFCTAHLFGTRHFSCDCHLVDSLKTVCKVSIAQQKSHRSCCFVLSQLGSQWGPFLKFLCVPILQILLKTLTLFTFPRSMISAAQCRSSLLES